MTDVEFRALESEVKRLKAALAEMQRILESMVMAQRQANLMQVDAQERFLNMAPTTSEMRKRYKALAD